MKYAIYLRSSLTGAARETDLDRQADHCRAIIEGRRGEVSVELRERGTR